MIFNNLNPNCTIYAFEPVKSTFNQLRNNVEKHKNIVPNNKGLFSQNCKKKINIFDSNTHSSLFDIKGISYQAKEKNTIELIKGDNFVKENKINEIDFIKLDIEVSEYDALLGFENNLKGKKIKAIQFEYGYINISTKKLLADFYTLLNDYEYTVGKIFPKNVEFRDYKFKYEDFIGPNFIAVDKRETGLIKSLKNN